MQQDTNDTNLIQATQLKDEFVVETSFQSIQEFSMLFSKSATVKCIPYIVKHRNSKYICFGCKETTCNFKVNARFNPSKNLCIVTQMNPFHSCMGIYSRAKISEISTLALKSSLIDDMTPKNLISVIRREYGQEVKYITAQKALSSYKVKNSIVLKDSYGFLNGLISTFNIEMTQSILELDNNNTFKRYFMTWNATKKFYGLSRKIITVDGTFLSGPNKGTLLIAVAQDGKDQLVLLAFAIVESENLDSWSFFIRNLNIHFNINFSNHLLISDRDHGLILSIRNILPNIVRRVCVRHLSKNLKNSFRDSRLHDCFWKAVYTYENSNFDSIMDVMKNLNLDYYNTCINADITSWTYSKCSVLCYGINTSNNAESMNSALKPFVSYDITNLIISINNYNMKKFNERRNERFNFTIFPKIISKIDSNVAMGRILSVEQSNNNLYLVEGKYLINFSQRKCSCNYAFEFGIPCQHFCAVINHLRLDPYIFVEYYFNVNNYNNSYSETILPLSSYNLPRDNLNPPIERRSRGRPRILRYRSVTEN